MKSKIVISFFLSLVFLVSCQKKTIVSSTAKYGANGGSSFNANTDYAARLKSANKKVISTLDEKYAAQQEFNKKKYKKINKMKKEKKYNDPTYFGHKKPPIKNPPGKKKLCKECNMWH
ncbi:MAG: hypothetical protein AB8B61_09740 [Cyclobacteriaceae bacterium]